MSVGSPAAFYLDEFGSKVWDVFGGPPYQVGSSLRTKTWRDVDVCMILSDKEWEQWQLGEPHSPNDKYRALCMAFSELGKRMTGLAIDFKLQQQTDANKRFKGNRSALGCLRVRKREACGRE